MAIFENKVITKYLADVSGEVQAIESLIRKNAQLKEAEKQAASEREKHFDQLVLDVSRAQRAEEDFGETVFKSREEAKRGTQELIGLYGKMAGGFGLSIAAIGAAENVYRYWQELEDRVTRTTNTALKFADESRTVNQVLAEQIDVAHNLRAPLENTMSLYDSVRDGLEGLNYSHREQIALSEQLGKAAILEGKGIEQAGEFIKKLSLTMSLGKNAGDLLKKLMEEMPAVAEQWVSKYGGSNKAFIAAVESGRVKFDDLVGALISGNGQIDESFAKRKRTNKEWRDEATEASERAQGAGESYFESVRTGINQANKGYASHRLTTVEWAEDVAAHLGRIEAKFKSTFEISVPHALKITTAAMHELAAGLPNLAKLIDPWATGSKDYYEFADDDMSDDVRSVREKRKAKAKQLAEQRKAYSNAVAKSTTDDLVKRLEAERDAGGDPISVVDLGIGSYDLPELPGVGGIDLQAPLKKLEDAAKTKRKNSFLESSFGSLEDFNAYATAFGMLTGSVTSAMDAWITGSMSAGDAVKAFIGQALKGLASQLAIEALKHGAYAIGSLAFGDLRGAGTHAAAAGAFGAAAAAAAVAAKEFGGGGTSYGKGASAGGGGASAAGGAATNDRDHRTGGTGPLSRDNSRPVVVIIGDQFADDSPRQRARRSQEAVDRALRERDE